MTTAILIIFVFFSLAAFAASLHFYLLNWRREQEANLSKRLEIYRKRINRTNRENRDLTARLSAVENLPRLNEANHNGLTANPRNNMENRYEAEILKNKTPVSNIIRVDNELRISE